MIHALTARQRQGVKLFALGFLPFAGFGLAYLLPMALTVRYSLLDSSFQQTFVGLENYAYIWSNRYFLLGMRNLLMIGAVAIAGAVVISLLVAWLLCRHPRLARVGMAVLILPLLIPSVSAVSVWQSAFHADILTPWWISMAALVTLYWWKFSGVGSVILYAALQRIPQSVLDAAALDGAGEWRAYFQIRLPMIREQLMLALIFLLMYFLRVYKESYLLFGQYTANEMYMVQHYMNNQYLKMSAEYVSAAAVSLTLLALMLYGAAYMLFGRRQPL